MVPVQPGGRSTPLSVAAAAPHAALLTVLLTVLMLNAPCLFVGSPSLRLSSESHQYTDTSCDTQTLTQASDKHAAMFHGQEAKVPVPAVEGDPA